MTHSAAPLTPVTLQDHEVASLRALQAKCVETMHNWGAIAHEVFSLFFGENADALDDVMKTVPESIGPDFYLAWKTALDARAALENMKSLILQQTLTKVDPRWAETNWGIVGDQAVDIASLRQND